MSVLHECRIDESQQDYPEDQDLYRDPKGQMERAMNEEAIRKMFAFDNDGTPLGARTLAIQSYSWGGSIYGWVIEKSVANLACMLGYACDVPNRPRKGRKLQLMDIDQVVKDWMDVVVRIAVAHDKDAADAAEAEVEKILTPLLSAPIKQIRQFYARLIETMKADPRVPFMVWRAFEHWHDQFIKPAPDEDIKQLKRELAEEIANMVEEDVRPDLKEAMVNALMWRNPKKLEEMKEAIVEGKAKGVKPRVKGRESCLFLQVPQESGDPKEVML